MLTQRELGQRLKSAREAIGLTQQQVADLLAHNAQASHVSAYPCCNFANRVGSTDG